MRPTPTFLTGDCRDVLKTFPENHFHACVTDSPYEISFMNVKWDSAGVSFQKETWAEILRVLRPGAHIFAFGGSRTFHRIGVAIEDAGFEIRDSFAWIYSQGFPHSMDIAKAIDNKLGVERNVVGTQMLDVGMQGGNMHADRPRELAEAQAWSGWGTCAKPAFEPIILGQKPISEPTIAENVLKWGVGGLNINETRIRYRSVSEWESLVENRKAHRTIRQGTVASGYGMTPEGIAATEQSPLGRFPANVILGHTPGCRPIGSVKVRGDGHWSGKPPEDGGLYDLGLKPVPDRGNAMAGADGLETVESWECVENCPIAVLDEQAGDRPAGGQPARRGPEKRRVAYGSYPGQARTPPGVGPSSGGASRFYYCAKADESERAFWCGTCGAAFMLAVEADHLHGKEDRNHLTYHLTVKPLALIEWLIKMVVPPGRTVLDPFLGSGTTCVAAQRLGFESVGVEIAPEHVAMAKVRCGIGVTGPLDRFAKAGAKS